MASLHDARRALDRGDVDEAMVTLWNALESLRLDGDRRGLEEAVRLAASAAAADEAYAAEAERLRTAVDGLTADTTGSTVVGLPHERTLAERLEEWAETVATAAGAGEAGSPDPFPTAPPTEAEPDGETGRGRKLGPVVWAVLVGLFLLLNVLGNVFGDG